ncbi:ThiF family adenylyltransferase [Streptacidiphilus sp. N1-10]|uniref:ThiF family adenylyltransferase n=1 Tax=Streptacidiphilus jeojiensis TaxID=3229225 RepID=A0ABV6Y0J9_9ACTN
MDEVDILSWRPRLRDSLVVEQDGGELSFISTSDRRVQRFSASETVFRMIPLLDGRHTVSELLACLCADSEELAHDVCSALVTLREERLLSKVAKSVDANAAVTPDHLSRYDRQIRLFQDFCDSDLLDYEEGLAAQRRLTSARVLVCGIGGLGSVVASSLAASGVGTVILCDDDVVEESNLTRQLMYSVDDIGSGKADALAARLSRINPYVSVVPEKRKVEFASDITDLVAAADLVISCADQPSVTEMAEIMTEACWPRTPHIIGGGYSYHVGIVGLLVIPGVTACWHCLRTEVVHEHGRDRAVPLIPKSRHAGILGAQSGIIGNMISWEAIRFLIGMGTAICNRWLELNYGPMSFSERIVPRRPDCPWCA